MRRKHRTRILVATIISELFAIVTMAFSGAPTLGTSADDLAPGAYIANAGDDIAGFDRQGGDPDTERHRPRYLRRGSTHGTWNLPEPRVMERPVFRYLARLSAPNLWDLPSAPDTRLPALRSPPALLS
jgi:hypothetical protein